MMVNQYVIFKSGKEEFGVPVSSVISIEKIQAITEIPKMPEYMQGITNFRGEIIPIFDMMQILFGQALTLDDDKNKIILVQHHDASVGLIVDEAKEIISVTSDDIKEVTGMVFDETPYINGVVTLNNRLVTLLNPEGLLNQLHELEAIHKQMEQLTV
ncbi:chemotaxis protein CheW [Bacillus sp. AK128]